MALITAGLPSSGLMSLSKSTPSCPIESCDLSSPLIESAAGEAIQDRVERAPLLALEVGVDRYGERRVGRYVGERVA